MNSMVKITMFLGLAVLLFALTACQENDQTIRVSGGWNFQTECLDGVEYWVGHQRLAVRVDPETMTYVRCGE